MIEILLRKLRGNFTPSVSPLRYYVSLLQSGQTTLMDES
jgi:hypothetical protein